MDIRLGHVVVPRSCPTSRAKVSRPAQSRPAQSRPAQSRPAQSRPAQSRPAQSRPNPQHQRGEILKPSVGAQAWDLGDPHPPRPKLHRGAINSWARTGSAVNKNRAPPPWPRTACPSPSLPENPRRAEPVFPRPCKQLRKFPARDSCFRKVADPATLSWSLVKILRRAPTRLDSSVAPAAGLTPSFQRRVRVRTAPVL
jgi:hypothetical protein